jgi:hypothetical protein
MGFMDKMKQAAEGVQAQTSKVGVGASRGQMDLANRAQKLMKDGVDTPATIDSMEPTGATDVPGGAENVVTATTTGGESRQITFNQYIYPAAPFAAGDSVMLKVDPDDPSVAMIFDKA